MPKSISVLPSSAALKKAAKTASTRAYAPYSGFRVGAAIWTDQGLFTGANVENASYGLSNCAERTAIFAAVAAGARRLYCVAVYTPTPTPTAPCGACRQVIFEFGGEDAAVQCHGDGTAEFSTTSGALLPGAFGPADLGMDAPKTYDAGRKATATRSKKTS